MASYHHPCFSNCSKISFSNLRRWDAGDLHEWSAISYPDKLLGFIEQEFKKMKQRQAQLLGMNTSINVVQSKL